jgi:hypothetical protein
MPAVGPCDRCGRALCTACAIPVRGRLVGPECLSAVVEDPGTPPRVIPALPSTGDVLVLAGFGLALAATLLRWSPYGGSRAYLGAWTPHWALVAALAALAGAAFALYGRVRPIDPRLVIGVVTVLALAGGLGAYSHYHNPPLLAGTTAAPIIAMAGCAVAQAGAIRKASALVRVRRAR